MKSLKVIITDCPYCNRKSRRIALLEGKKKQKIVDIIGNLCECGFNDEIDITKLMKWKKS